MIIADHEELERTVARIRGEGRRVVFTNGVFDLLHVGHIRYLQEARATGDCLLVAVNADSSVRSFKGDLRPIVPAAERGEVLDSLRCVDLVTYFDSRTPAPLVERLQPDIYVKGGDYRVEDLPEAAIVRRYGGEVRILVLVPGRSTTDIIGKICAAYGQDNKPEG